MKRSIAVLALCVASLAAPVAAQQPHGPPQQHPAGRTDDHMPAEMHDPIMESLFPPELVMQYQGEIGLSDAQRQTISTAIQQAQTKSTDAQWKISAEAEKLHKLLQSATVDETQALEQVDRILTLEREVKRAHMTLMVKIKNALTPAQQDKLREHHKQMMEQHHPGPGGPGEGGPPLI